MPFTFAHPAAVLPLAPLTGRWLVFSALVVGAMAPDFGYLVPGGYVHSRTHTLLSLFWFSLPAGLVVWWLFQVLVKRPLIAIAPSAWQPRLSRLVAPHPATRGRGLPAVIVSVLIGAATHQGIDAATHGDGALVTALPVLRTELLRVGGHPLTAYRLLQHGLSLVGLVALAWCGLRWLRKAPAEQPQAGLAPAARRLLWAGLALVPLIAASASLGQDLGRRPLKLAFGYAAVAAIGAVFLELLVLGLAWRFGRRGSGTGI